MGEIADMHLDGTLCECCGFYIEGEAPGYPRYCSKECAKDRGIDNYEPNNDCDDEEGEEVTLEDIEITTQILLQELKEAKALNLRFPKTQQTLIDSIEKILEDFENSKGEK